MRARTTTAGRDGHAHGHRPLTSRLGWAALAGGMVATLVVGSAGAASTPNRFLLRTQEQPGFTVNGTAATETTAAAFLHSVGATGREAAKLKAILKDAGFRRATDEQLLGSQGRQGGSEVVELRKAAGARKLAGALLSLTRAHEHGARISTFAVKGVPSAKGITAHGGGAAIANAYWVAGSCVLASSIYLPVGGRETNAMVAGPVIAGIRSQAHRIRNHCS